MKTESRYTFSINLPTSLYHKLVDEAGKGKVSTFVRRMLEERFSEKEDNLINEYQECYSNPRMLKEAKQWEKANIKSWLNYEKSRSKKNS
jgi:hypothetical protein